MSLRQRFSGSICGVGTTSGVRIVVGAWTQSPFGEFCDVMLEGADGHRVLYAPSDVVAEFVSQTYVFDEVRVGNVALDRDDDHWSVTAGDLDVEFRVGRRTWLGRAIRVIPSTVATSTLWAGAIDPIARVVLRGVRTRGSALDGRREWYGATDVRRIVWAAGTLAGASLGDLAPVDPPCRFGFSSTPRTPSVTTVVTTVEL